MAFKLYIDEDAMSHALVDGLRARGVDVVSVLDAALTGKDDESQLEFAVKQTRVIYSYNVEDFCRLHSTFLRQGKEHAGIVIVNLSVSRFAAC